MRSVVSSAVVGGPLLSSVGGRGRLRSVGRSEGDGVRRAACGVYVHRRCNGWCRSVVLSGGGRGRRRRRGCGWSPRQSAVVNRLG